jgi:hypothetical protein
MHPHDVSANRVAAPTRADWLQFAKHLSDLFNTALSSGEYTTRDKADEQFIAIPLLMRSKTNLQGVLQLLDQGLIVEARVLVRCVLENAFVAAILDEKGREGVDGLVADYASSRVKQGELILNALSAFTDEQRAEVAEIIAETEREYPKRRRLVIKTAFENTLGVPAQPPHLDYLLIRRAEDQRRRHLQRLRQLGVQVTDGSGRARRVKGH